MGMQLRNRPARYTLGAGVAAVLAIGTGGLVAAASAAASPASSAGGRPCSTSATKEKLGPANSGPYGGNQTVFLYTRPTATACRSGSSPTAPRCSRSPSSTGGHPADVALGFKTLAIRNTCQPAPISPNFGGLLGETIGR